MKKYLNRQVISEIQSYLADMDWSGVHHSGEQFINFIKGVTYALWAYGISFELKSEIKKNNEEDHKLEVYRLLDPNDYWSNKEHLFDIYANRIEEIK